MKNITLYNNYPDTAYFEQKRKELYNMYADIQCYDDESDVPYSFVKSEIDYENEVQYNNFIYQMQRLFEKTAFTLYGTIQTLLGECTNYTFVDNFAQFELFIKNVKYLKIHIENDMLKIQCEHHQGTNHYMAGMTCNEIAEFLDISRITVWRRRTRAQVKYKTLFN